MIINPVDIDELRARVLASEPFPYFCIDNFLDETFAYEVASQFPSFEEASLVGKRFNAVAERNKIQITDQSKFPPAIKKLNDTLSSDDWLSMLSYVMNIPNLLADSQLVGGGIHETGPRGHLDVHVDFNYIKTRQLYRRLNILIYFNKNWLDSWGGHIELWDKDVSTCRHSFSPQFNRCVVFETSEISFHGVTAVRCPKGESRKSFAAYYYTKERPSHWTGDHHSTIFKARPEEWIKGTISMPFEKFSRNLKKRWRSVKSKLTSPHND